jgi:hypothetical protein
MSEQPTTPQHANLPADELAGWDELARASSQWPQDHEGLQQLKHNHVHRILADKGLEHLISNYLITNSDEPDGAHVERAAWQPKTEEQLSDFMTESLGEALAKLIGDRTSTRPNGILKNSYFLGRAQERGIDVMNRADNKEFWDFFAEQAEQYIDKHYASGDSMVELDSIQVLSRLPQFLLADQRLSANDYPSTELLADDPAHPKMADKLTASRFNNALREYINKYPEVSARAFQGALTDMAIQMRNQARETDAQSINETLWGAQVESAFGRILANIGNVRGATATEDVHNIDLVTEPDTPDEVCFDIKASDYKLDDIRRRLKLPTPSDPVQRMYVILHGHSQRTKQDGSVIAPSKDRVIFCPTPNSTRARFQSLFMKDRFQMSDDMIAHAAEGFKPIIDQIRQDIQSHKHNQRRTS